MSYEAVLYETSAGRATITLNRPERRNATTLKLYEELLSAAEEARRDSAVRVVVLTGAGTAFSAGQDHIEAAQLGAAGYARYDAANRAAREYFQQLSKPVVGRINGPAVGGACLLALLSCDITIAALSARFALREVHAGIPGPSALLYALGRTRALYLALTGDWLDAETAARWGLIHSAVPSDQLDAAVDEIVSKLASLPPLALSATKEQMSFALRTMGLDQTTEFALLQEKVLNQSQDRDEAQRAFAEKRQASFAGR